MSWANILKLGDRNLEGTAATHDITMAASNIRMNLFHLLQGRLVVLVYIFYNSQLSNYLGMSMFLHTADIRGRQTRQLTVAYLAHRGNG